MRREYQALRQALKESGEQGYWRTVLDLQLDRKDKNLLLNGRYESLAMIYARLGQNEKALKQLEKEIETGDYDIWLKTEAAYDRLRDDPRFKAVLRRTELDK